MKNYWQIIVKANSGDMPVKDTLESFRTEVTAVSLRINHQEVRRGEIYAEVVPDDS